MEVHSKQLNIVTRLRKTYVDAAFDAVLYYLLSDEGKNVADIDKKVKRAISFCESEEAEAYYRQVHDHLSSKSNMRRKEERSMGSPSDKVDADADGDDSIYTFSRERANAAKHETKCCLNSKKQFD